MFYLCTACADTMNQGNRTYSDDERCNVGTWLVDEVVKALEVGYGLVDFEFWNMRRRALTRAPMLDVFLQST